MCADVRIPSLLAALISVSMVLSAGPARAFPDRPINLILPWGAGGGGDRVGRVIANVLAPTLGVSVPVINVPGASGQVGLAKVLREPADGYTITEITSDTYILFAGAHPRFKVSDFTPLAVVDQQPSGFFVREDSPWKVWDDVVRFTKSRNAKVAGSGFGTQSDATVSYFNKTVGLKLVSVPFDEPGMRWDSLLGGHTDLLYAQFGDLATYLANKQLRPILVFAAQRLASYPGVPTDKELGYAIDITHFRAFAIKPGTTPARYTALVTAMNTVAKSAMYKDMLQSETALPDSYISGRQAEDYISSWVNSVHNLLSKAGN